MLEIVFLIISGGAVASYARTRGGQPAIWGTVAIAGYVLFLYVLPFVLKPAPDSDTHIWLLAGGLGWVGAVAFCARFLLGAGSKKPSGMWTCPSCKFLNQHYAVFCEACKQPYGEPASRI